jgi:hypothetical protein
MPQEKAKVIRSQVTKVIFASVLAVDLRMHYARWGQASEKPTSSSSFFLFTDRPKFCNIDSTYVHPYKFDTDVAVQLVDAGYKLHTELHLRFINLNQIHFHKLALVLVMCSAVGWLGKQSVNNRYIRSSTKF